MHRALRCTHQKGNFPTSHFPPSHFPPSESVHNLITGVVSSIFPNLSLHVLVLVHILFSSIHKVLLIMPLCQFYLLHPHSLYLYSCSQLFPFLFLTPHLRRKSNYWIISCCISSFHLSHLISSLWLGL
jgi:hypothetical protein